MKVPHAWEDMTDVEQERLVDEYLAKTGATDAQKQDVSNRSWARGTIRFMLQGNARPSSRVPANATKENA